jgi:hypothetical protein
MGKVGRFLGQIFSIVAMVAINVFFPGLGSLASALIIGGAAILGGYLSSMMQPQDAQEAGSGLDIMMNMRHVQRPVPIIYGTRKMGSNDVFMGTSIEDKGILWVVHVLGEGPIEGIATNEEGQDLIQIDEESIYKFNEDEELIQWYFYAGTADQVVPPELEAEVPVYDDNLRYTAYIAFRFRYNPDKFRSIPRRRVVVKGRKILDYRTDVIAYSENPALILYDYMVGDDESGHYGLRFSADAFEMTSWIAAANYCDTVGYRYHDIIYRNSSSIAVVQKILAHFRGVLGWDQGQFWLRYLDLRYEVPVYHIQNSQILQADDGNAVVSIKQPGRFTLPDGMNVRWVDPIKDYTVDEVLIGKSGQLQQVDFTGFKRRKLALNMGHYNLQRARSSRLVSLTGRDDLLEVEHHDLVEIDCEELELENALMRIQSQSVTEDGLISLSLIFEDESFYEEVYEDSDDEIYDVWFDPYGQSPPSVVNISVEEELYTYRERTMLRLRVNFSPPPNYPWFHHALVYIAYGQVPIWSYLEAAKTTFYIENAEEGIIYWLRFQTVSLYGTTQPREEAPIVKYTAIGISDIYPLSPNPLSLTVNAMSVAFYSEPVDDPDLAGYEIRLGSTWASGIKVAFLSGPYITYGSVKPGNHTFFLNTQATNGLYGIVPQSASAFLQEPPAFHIETQRFPIDFTQGTLVNMQLTPEGWLECAQANDVLTGNYTSVIFDHAVSERLLVYVNYDYVLDAGGLRWDDLVPVPETWETNFIGRRWYDIFMIDESAQLNIGLNYSTDIVPPFSMVERLELLTASVTARGFQVRLKIIDSFVGRHLKVKSAELILCTQAA